MNLVEALGEAESAEPASALYLLAERVKQQVETLRLARQGERERLAAWFIANGDEIKALASDGLSVESVAFLLRMAGE